MFVWDAFTEEFVRGALTTIGVGVLLGFLSKLFGFISHLFATAKDFDVRGFWVGSCWMPSYEGHQAIEFWKYRRFRSRVRFVFFAYEMPGNSAVKARGEGTIRNNTLSAFYYHPTSMSYESGVLALQIKRLRLQGIYAQFDVKRDAEELYIGKDYVQYRAILPFFARLKMIIGLPPFRSFDRAKSAYEAARDRHPMSV